MNADGSLNTTLNPVHIGDSISLYATGEGQTTPIGSDGALALTLPYPKPDQPVQIFVGGQAAQIAYAGAAPTEVAGVAVRKV